MEYNISCRNNRVFFRVSFFFFYFLGQFSTNDHDGNYARKYEKLYAQFYAYFSLFDKILMKYCIVSDIWNTRLQVR